MSEKIDINKSELEHFVGGRVWKIIVQATIDGVNEKMASILALDPCQEPTQIARCQGYIEALGFIVDYPAILAEQIEYESKTNKEEKEDGK